MKNEAQNCVKQKVKMNIIYGKINESETFDANQLSYLWHAYHKSSTVLCHHDSVSKDFVP